MTRKPLQCDRCGARSTDPDVIPYNPTTGQPIRSNTFTGWPDAILCKRCWWALNTSPPKDEGTAAMTTYAGLNEDSRGAAARKLLDAGFGA
jgi:hypothetical protein